MRLLVLGGTWFLGKQVVHGALERGWDVTTFNRGRSAPHVPGTRTVHGDRTDAADLTRLAAKGPWDVVIDTSSSELPPRDVLLAADMLGPRVRRWVHISTVSVYEGWPNEPLTEESPLLVAPADADATYGYLGENGSPTPYGFQKAGGEAAVREHLGDRCVFLRPGVILGPGEYVGRLPWWLRRAERGGRIVAPAPAYRRIQPVDVRDVAEFALRQAGGEESGAFNLAHPVGIEIGDFLRACLDVTGGPGRLVWVQPEDLIGHGVRQWTELPLWRTQPGTWQVDATRAVEAGLTCRPVVETIEQTWAWMQADGRAVEHPRAADHGLESSKEAKILADLQ